MSPTRPIIPSHACSPSRRGHRQRIKTQTDWIIIIYDDKTDVQECSITAGKYHAQIVIVIIRYSHPKFNIIVLRQNTITNTATRSLLDQRCSASPEGPASPGVKRQTQQETQIGLTLCYKHIIT